MSPIDNSSQVVPLSFKFSDLKAKHVAIGLLVLAVALAIICTGGASISISAVLLLRGALILYGVWSILTSPLFAKVTNRVIDQIETMLEIERRKVRTSL